MLKKKIVVTMETEVKIYMHFCSSLDRSEKLANFKKIFFFLFIADFDALIYMWIGRLIKIIGILYFLKVPIGQKMRLHSN